MCNSISDDDYFNRGHLENRLPLLPVNVPYMVKLKSYIETPNLIFLVLQYASGGKLFDYINNYAKSVPNTPAREVNLENVFVNLNDIVENNKTKENSSDESEQKCPDLSISIGDLTVNSQKLLSDVDNALTEKCLNKENCRSSTEKNENGERSHEKPNSLIIGNQTKMDTEENNFLSQSKVRHLKFTIFSKIKYITFTFFHFKFFKKISALPPKSICKWSAELLTAIDNLHKFGIICRLLNNDKIFNIVI